MDEILYEGKSKVLLRGPSDDVLLVRYKDTATAFDGKKKEELAGKGRLNAAISNLIYDYLAQHDVQTHLVEVLDETSALVKQAEIVMVEVIVRNVAAGSFSRKYGVEEGSALQHPTIEFSVKSDELGDPMINGSQITAIGLATQDELTDMIAQAKRINELLCVLFARAEIRLVDFKLEFGRFDGHIILCDEISPDSCRLWDMQTGEKLDKDRFRRDLGNVLDGYEEVLRRLSDVA
ncbi:MAG: phosphoribosylaminoimidazolesuccinocarboxamide synthase [Oscillospiraceae bacterium]|nr:phosphoribosylaminoimidazolesuccinocarboxamide synthase [Oscillospiraceae bacterium]